MLRRLTRRGSYREAEREEPRKCPRWGKGDRGREKDGWESKKY